MDYKTICEKTKTICIETGQFIISQRSEITPEKIEEKNKNDYVTFVDKTAEKQLVEKLSDLLPEAGFIVEENTTNRKGEVYNWIVDPLDGTTNFIHGLAPHAVSVALQENGRTVAGVVYETGRDECFYAWKDNPAFLNGNKIRVSQAKTLSDSLIATGFPYYDYSKLPRFVETLQYFMRNTQGIRRFGSAATDLVYVACGRFDAFFEYSLKPWDVAAGAFILEQAGGKVSDFSGKDNYLFGQEMVGANAAVFPEFLNVINQIINK